MTMLYSFFSSQGITFAADSRIWRPGSPSPDPQQRKVQRVPRVGGGQGLIGYYGLAEVGGRPMGTWLSTLIGRWPGSRDPEDFATHLVEQLKRSTTARERREISGFHFGAFSSHDHQTTPVFFHIKNTHKWDGEQGVHTDIGEFWQEEQLMAYHLPRLGWSPSRIREHLERYQRTEGVPLWYRNGDLPLLGTVAGHLSEAIQRLSLLPQYSTPASLAGWERIAKTMVVTTGQLATAMFRGKVPTVGGPARVLSIPWPPQ